MLIVLIVAAYLSYSGYLLVEESLLLGDSTLGTVQRSDVDSATDHADRRRADDACATMRAAGEAKRKTACR